MAYCDIDDVQNLGVHGGVAYRATGTPNITNVNSAINIIYRQINARLKAAGVITPVVEVTSPLAYALLKDLNAIGAAWYAEKIAWREITALDPDDDKTTPGGFAEVYENTLCLYEKNPRVLSDATFTAYYSMSHNIESDAMYSPLVDSYDYSHMDDKEDETLKPWIKYDTKW